MSNRMGINGSSLRTVKCNPIFTKRLYKEFYLAKTALKSVTLSQLSKMQENLVGHSAF